MNTLKEMNQLFKDEVLLKTSFKFCPVCNGDPHEIRYELIQVKIRGYVGPGIHLICDRGVSIQTNFTEGFNFTLRNYYAKQKYLKFNEPL